MLLIDFLRFLAMLLLAGTLIRLAQARLADTPVGPALAFIY